MIKIFAKHGTDEKAIMFCPNNHVVNIRKALAEKYGGNWVYVDNLIGNREVLKFNDGLKYLGYHGRNERYSSGIDKLY